jgi:hypothetical protein
MENLKIEPDVLDLETINVELEARKVDISKCKEITQARELLKKHLIDEAAGTAEPPDPVTDPEKVIEELKFMSAGAPKLQEACLRYAAGLSVFSVINMSFKIVFFFQPRREPCGPCGQGLMDFGPLGGGEIFRRPHTTRTQFRGSRCILLR